MNENKGKVLKGIFSDSIVPERYSKYRRTERNGEVFYSWAKYNDRLIKSPDFNWDQYFQLIDPIRYVSTSRRTGNVKEVRSMANTAMKIAETVKTGYLRPQFNFISLSVAKEDYNRIINKFGLNKGKIIPLNELSNITSYRDSLMDQMNRQSEEISILNEKIAAILKVCFFETEVSAESTINEQGSDEDEVTREFWNRVNDIERIFVVIQSGISSDRIKNSWIPESILTNPFICDHLKKATLNGIMIISKDKDPLLDMAEKLSKEIIVLESVIEDAFLNDRLSTDDEFEKKEEVRPSDKWDWIESEYLKNRDNFNTDDAWAKSTALKFKETFNTKTPPSIVSIKRYGIYKGAN